MDSRWLRNVPKNEIEQRQKEIRSYKNAFDEAIKVLEEEVEKSTPDYTSPSWSHEMADQCGANRKLRSIIALLKLKE